MTSTKSKKKITNSVPEIKTETTSVEQEIKNSQISDEIVQKPKLEKLKLNFVGMIYLTCLRLRTLTPLEKIVLSYITGLILDEKIEERTNRFKGFNEAHFRFYSEKYKNHLLDKIKIPLFKKVTESLQCKNELTLNFDFLGRADVTLFKRHTTGCCIPIFEIDPENRLSTNQPALVLEDNIEAENGFNKTYDYNYTAWLFFSGLIKCANQSLVECEGFYVNRIQIIKLASLLQLPDAVVNNVMNYLFKIHAVFTKTSLEDPEKEFSIYELIKNDKAFTYLYINESLVSSYMNLFPNYAILHYSYAVSRSSSAFTGKYR